MTKEQAIKTCEIIKRNKKFNLCNKIDNNDVKAIEEVLNLIQQLQEENKQKTSLYKRTMNELRRVDEELAEKETIIENAINEVENLRQDFSEDVQPDFVRILEILKNKKSYRLVNNTSKTKHKK